MKSKPGWGRQRRLCLQRDKRCMKCRAARGLEAHHIKERCEGGSDDLDNLVTLCSLCHDEWTWTQPPLIVFDTWLLLPPARSLPVLFQMDWPDDMSAADFRMTFLRALDSALEAHEARMGAKP